MNTAEPLERWVAMLGGARIPVLRRSVEVLTVLAQREDEVTARELSAVILRDPMLTLLVLRYLQVRRSSRRIADITTIAHAIMMLGVSPFFREFHELAVVEDMLGETPAALQGLFEVIGRARHAAWHASVWAEVRCDIETDEVAVAALLHDMAEMLLWIFAPASAMDIAARLDAAPGMRSAVAQKAVLGFGLAELQSELCRAWELPELLRTLMDEHQSHRPRANNVLLAVALARHSAHGWQDPALPDDLSGIGEFLGWSEEEVRGEVYRIALLAADEQAAGQSAALWLPPAPMFAETPPLFFDNPRESQENWMMGRLCERLSASPAVRRPLIAQSGRSIGLGSNVARLDVIGVLLHGMCALFDCEAAILLTAAGGARFAVRFMAGGRQAARWRGLVLDGTDAVEAEGLVSLLPEELRGAASTLRLGGQAALVCAVGLPEGEQAAGRLAQLVQAAESGLANFDTQG